MYELTEWAIAIEAPHRLRRDRQWVHAYDLVQDRVPHSLAVPYEIRRDSSWRTATESPRCQHCFEIVGQYR